MSLIKLQSICALNHQNPSHEKKIIKTKNWYNSPQPAQPTSNPDFIFGQES